MRTCLLFLHLVLTAAVLHAQPDTLWMHPYPQLTRSTLMGVVQASDGGFGGMGEHMIMPDTFSAYPVMSVIKTDADGNLLATWECPGSQDTISSGRAICATLNGGFAVLGHNGFNGNQRNFLVVRFWPDGLVAWQRQYDVSSFDWASDITAAPDGGFVVSGHNAGVGDGPNEAQLLKIDANGDSVWSALYSGTTDFGADFVAPARDGGYVFAGRAYELDPSQPSTSNFLIAKVDADGTMLWQHIYGQFGLWEYPFCFTAADEGYISAAMWGYGLRLVRFNDEGDTLWTRPVQLDGDECHLNVLDVEAEGDGGFVFAGYCATVEQPSVLFKVDRNGDMIWQAIRGRGNRDGATGLCLTSGGYVTCGNTGAGPTGGWGSPCLTRWGSSPNSMDAPSSVQGGFALQQNYPNPFNPVTEIAFDLYETVAVKLTIYDVLGREVACPVDGLLTAGHHRALFRAGDQPTGIYFYKLRAANGVQTRKMMLLK